VSVRIYHICDRCKREFPPEAKFVKYEVRSQHNMCAMGELCEDCLEVVKAALGAGWGVHLG
jgi:hypothetical protein